MRTRVGRGAIVVACGLWLAGSSPAAAQTASDPPADTQGPATGSLQNLLETRVAELRDKTELTAVAVAAMIDGDLAGAAVSGDRRRNSGISVTVDDRWHLGSVTQVDDRHAAGRAGG
jgi:CubicO group peptidase (beta-lactamase class C family)